MESADVDGFDLSHSENESRPGDITARPVHVRTCRYWAYTHIDMYRYFVYTCMYMCTGILRVHAYIHMFNDAHVKCITGPYL